MLYFYLTTNQQNKIQILRLWINLLLFLRRYFQNLGEYTHQVLVGSNGLHKQSRELDLDRF